ncbi:MAG: hypothetical protein Q9171_005372 [Xanthocarpia ochracea]
MELRVLRMVVAVADLGSDLDIGLRVGIGPVEGTGPVEDTGLGVGTGPGEERHGVAVAAGKDCELGEDMVVAGAGDMGYGHEGVAEAEAGRIGLAVGNPAADQDLEEVPVVEHHKLVAVSILEADIEVVHIPVGVEEDTTCCEQ